MKKKKNTDDSKLKTVHKAIGTAGMSATGACIGSLIPGVGTLIGAGVGAALGAIVSNKDEE